MSSPIQRPPRPDRPSVPGEQPLDRPEPAEEPQRDPDVQPIHITNPGREVPEPAIFSS